MATRDDDSDDSLLEHEEKRPSSDGNRPLLLAGIGLVLMLGGYAVMNYEPQALERAEQEHRLSDLRRQAAQQQAEGTVDGLSERLNQIQPPRRNPPYQLLGRLAIYGGLFLFVMAGVLMYRSSPPPKENEQE